MDILLTIVVFATLGFLVWKEFFVKKDGFGMDLQKEKDRLFEEKARLESELRLVTEKVGHISKDLEKEREEKNEFAGKNKRMFVENESLKNDVSNLREKLVENEKIISEYRAEKNRRDKEYEARIEKLENAREKLEKEQIRVMREDEEEIKNKLEEQARIWNDHENMALSRLREICQKPSIGFNYYENTNMPSGFDAKLKPDFMVDFLGQYIVFDAKCSKQKSPHDYIYDQVKKTALKYKGNESIYSGVFFVVSQNEISNLRQLTFIEEGFTFYIISIESLEPILANFKKITDYENLENFDPQDRENIVNLIANYDRHISFQNAANILLVKESVGLMNSKDNLPSDLLSEVKIRKQNMRPFRFKEAEIKKISQSFSEQEREVDKLVSPKSAVDKADLDDAQNALFDTNK